MTCLVGTTIALILIPNMKQIGVNVNQEERKVYLQLSAKERYRTYKGTSSVHVEKLDNGYSNCQRRVSQFWPRWRTICAYPMDLPLNDGLVRLIAS